MKKGDIGLIGLAVMGENLALNMERNGFTVAVFNRSVEKVDAFVGGRGAGKNFIPCHSLASEVLQRAEAKASLSFLHPAVCHGGFSAWTALPPEPPHPLGASGRF